MGGSWLVCGTLRGPRHRVNAPLRGSAGPPHARLVPVALALCACRPSIMGDNREERRQPESSELRRQLSGRRVHLGKRGTHLRHQRFASKLDGDRGWVA